MVYINVSQATPNINWNIPANDIVYGTPLSSAQLDANATDPTTGKPVAGFFIYDPPLGTVFSGQTLSTTFTPDDYINYTTASATASITSTQTTPIIQWDKPDDITYGTLLGGTQLNAVASDPTTGNPLDGTYAYINATGTVENIGSILPAGLNQALTVTFTPDDSTDYITATKTVYININNPAPPTASFTVAPTYGVAPLTVTCTDTSTNNPTFWSWNFGNGSSPVSYTNFDGIAHVLYTYNKAGSYTITLTVSNDYGSSTAKFSYINVSKSAPPIANFTGTPTTGYAPLIVQFNDKSKGLLQYWNYSFGDGTHSTNLSIANPTHTYINTGNYTVNLTASNPAGWSTITKRNYIKVKRTTPITIGSIVGIGTHTLTATFTPTNTITYTPILTWTPNPLPSIVYGTPLSSAYLDATATYNGQTVPGNFVYTDQIGTAETDGSGKIAQNSITPNPLPSIIYGTPLSSAHPDATAKYNEQTVLGNFVYADPLGITETDNSGTIIQNSITVTPNVQNAALTIVKSADPTSYDDVEQTITYHYTVTNSGNADISAPITVTDDKAGTVPIQNSGILSPGSSVTGSATYKITDADINTGSVTNLASATGSFNNQPVVSPQNIVTVHYKQPTNDRNNNGRSDNSGYGGAVIPVPMIYSNPMSNPMYASVPGGYGSEPYGYSSGSNVYTNEPSTTEALNSDSNGHKAKAHLSKHKHHTTKHHKTGKNHSK